MFSGNAAQIARRETNILQTGINRVSLMLKAQAFPSTGNVFMQEVRDGTGVAVPIATQWQLRSDGHFWVMDGDGMGGGTSLDTGFACTPGSYQAIDVLIDNATEKWEFFVDGVHFNGPHPLGFFQHVMPPIAAVTEIDFTYTGSIPGGVFLDALSVIRVPEPSSLALLGLAVFGWSMRGTRQSRV